MQPLTLWLGVLFVVLAVANASLMLWLWGFPMDPATGKSTAPRRWKLLHRGLGYCYILIYLFMMARMVPRLWMYQEELAARTVAHAFLGVAIGAVLLTKISIIRFFPAFRKHLPVFGISLVVLTVTALALPLTLALKEWSAGQRALAAGAPPGLEAALAAISAATPAQAAHAASTPGLKAGRGHFLQSCTQCHDVRRSIRARKSPAEWHATVIRMAAKVEPDRHAFIVGEARLLITAYLSTISGAPPTDPRAATPAETAPIAAPTGVPAQAPDAEAVAAILANRCAICHSGAGAPKGLRLESPAQAAASSAVVAGSPAASELVRRVKGVSLPRMPMDGPPWLTDAEVATIEAWITQLGAADAAPAGEVPTAPVAVPPPTPPALPGPGEPVLFTHVRPILMQHCVKCHTPNGLRGPAPEGLVLSSWESLLAAPERAVVLPGQPAASMLMRHITGRERPRMPLDGPPWLDEEQVLLLTRWIQDGARDAQGQRAPIPTGAEVRFTGILESQWVLDGVRLQVTGETEIRDAVVGRATEVRARVRSDGSLEAERIRGR